MSSISTDTVSTVLQCHISFNLEITKELKDTVDTIVTELEEVTRSKYNAMSCNGPTYYEALASNSLSNITEDYRHIQKMKLEAFQYWYSHQEKIPFGITTIVFNELFISDAYDKISFDIASSFIF